MWFRVQGRLESQTLNPKPLNRETLNPRIYGFLEDLGRRARIPQPGVRASHSGIRRPRGAQQKHPIKDYVFCFRVYGFGFRVHDILWYTIVDYGFRVQGLGCRV